MKKLFSITLIALTTFCVIACSSTKTGTDLKASRSTISGTWAITDIMVDVPAGFLVSNVFDEAPYEDFKGSTWELIRNGKGSFALANGTSEEIYWSIFGSGTDAQFQFKKLNGENPKNVDEGYRLQLQNITDTSFIAKSVLDVGDSKTGTISYHFTKK